MKRILVFSTFFYPHVGGVENYVMNLFSKLKNKGIKTTVITLNTNNSRDYELRNGLEIYRLPCLTVIKDLYYIPNFFSRKYWKFMKKIELNKYDFVNTNTRFYLLSFMGMLFARKNKIKYIHTEHGSSFVKNKNPIISIISFLFDATIGRFIISKSDIAVGVSSSSSNFSKSLGAKKTGIVYNSVSSELLKEHVNKKSKKPSIVYVGRLIESKGVNDLLYAIKGLDLKLTVVGRGKEFDNLISLSKELNLDVDFLGEIANKKAIKIMKRHDIFVNPSYSEGLPTTVLEAGALDLAVIATDVGGTREIINNYNTGLLFKPGDRNTLKKLIEKLENNRNLRKKLASNLKIKIREKFTWDVAAERFFKLLNHI